MQLPGGSVIGIGSDMIIEPGFEWFPCPPDHFWYWKPDEQLNVPPFTPGQQILRDAVHALVPETVEGLYPYLIVLLTDLITGKIWWRGDWLDGFMTTLDSQDLAVLKDWLEQPTAQNFLNNVLETCRAQADYNQKHNNKPFVTFNEIMK